MNTRLIQGDCLVELRRLAEEGVKVDCVLADPPFGVTPGKWDKVIPAEAVWESLLPLLKPETPIAMFGREPMASEYRLAARDLYKYDLIWNKGQGVDFLRAKRKPMSCYEKIMIFSRGSTACSKFAKGYMTYNPQMLTGTPFTAKENKKRGTSVVRQKEYVHPAVVNKGTRYPLEIINFPKPAKSPEHLTQKPIPLMEWLVRTYSNRGGWCWTSVWAADQQVLLA